MNDKYNPIIILDTDEVIKVTEPETKIRDTEEDIPYPDDCEEVSLDESLSNNTIGYVKQSSDSDTASIRSEKEINAALTQTCDLKSYVDFETKYRMEMIENNKLISLLQKQSNMLIILEERHKILLENYKAEIKEKNKCMRDIIVLRNHIKEYEKLTKENTGLMQQTRQQEVVLT